MSYSDFNTSSMSFTYTAPAFVAEQSSSKQKPVYDVERYPESSNKIMCHQEVLDFFNKKRTTIIAWRKSRNFPEPISKSPLRWLREAVMEWVEYEGGFKS
ncbi:helix-turn-helix transcriptional regulator [Vibrio coralliilyticus]|uniref:helix-turn-helix transcriptional regulator n=1 Tax=Vibrio coralliilyticus TaxID=190893 RepID=UPI0039173613